MNLHRLRYALLGGLAFGSLALALPMADLAMAQGFRRGSDYGDYGVRPRSQAQQQSQMTPVLAVVSLNEQHITVYGPNGKLLQSAVSSGSTGYETPSGIFSIVQKKPQHNSNLYDDASMPFMQRITWTGIALHAGALPGYPASHGCVRLPITFAEQLFDVTKMGMRVILTRDDILPQDFSHPALFRPRPVVADVQPLMPRMTRIAARSELPISRIGTHAYDNVLTPSPVAERQLGILGSIAAQKTAESDKASRRAAEAKQNAQRKAAEAAAASRNIKAAEFALQRGEEAVKAAAKALEAMNNNPKAKPEQIKAAEVAKEKADARLVELRTALETVTAQNKSRIEAAEQAAEELKAAELAKDQAVDAAEEANRSLSPVSVFVSRKMRRFYVRQANLPVMEGPITIKDPDTNIGTFVYTAMDFAGDTQNMRWSVVSMYKSLKDVKFGAPAETATPAAGAAAAPKRNGPKGEAVPADVAGAAAALERISFPDELVERVSQLLIPGSSLIISDENASLETGKDTDFIVVMSGEPQGALKIRAPQPRRSSEDKWDKWEKGGGGSPFSFLWN